MSHFCSFDGNRDSILRKNGRNHLGPLSEQGVVDIPRRRGKVHKTEKCPEMVVLTEKGPKVIVIEAGVLKNAKTVISQKSGKIDGYASVFSQNRDFGHF